MKLLLGSEIADFVKERQAHQVRRLKQSKSITPKLAIIVTVNDPVIEVYLRLKKKYATDIGAAADLYRLEINEVSKKVNELNKDESVHGIIIQLPISEPDKTEELVNLVSPKKDVDGLNKKTEFDPATPLAILWLLSGFNVELKGKNIAIVGRGKLVGGPLEKALIDQGLSPKVINRTTKDLKQELLEADVIISATGVPGLIKSDMIKQGAVVVDAGVAGEDGKTVGDVDQSIYENRADLTITPKRGGVGPLTVCALFDNLIRAAEKS